jgi:asparagine synthase (glutamine-hydrolysing)
MRGVVPDEILGRTTKGDFIADVYTGLRQCRKPLLDLFADSVLAKYELINVDVFRKAILGLHSTFGTLIPLEQTIACEVWVRAANKVSCQSL